MKIHLDLDSYFVSAERTRYPHLVGKNVVVAKGSDKKIFSRASCKSPNPPSNLRFLEV